MPIQWSGRITSPQMLAGVIQGESATPAGQFAVASVMYNRTNMSGPYVGGGSGDITAVVLPSQFNGYNPNPSPGAQSLANALWNNQPPPGGSTGNATFFAAPDAGNAGWANPNTAAGSAYFASGTNIGGNTYSDNQGPASSNFQPPSYNGAGTAALGPNDGSSGLPAGPGQNGDYLTMNPSDPNYGDITGIPVAGVNAPAAGGAGTGTGTTTTPPASTTPSSTGAQGTPIQTALQPEETSFISSTVAGIESAMGAGLTKTLQAAGNAVGTMFGGISNWFVRAGLIILAIVLIAIGLLVMLWDHGGKETAGRIMEVAAA